MKPYQQQFIAFAIQNKAVLFGEFKLKSGRISPYFFNAGQFNTGAAISQLGIFYAEAIMDSGIEFDILFGPAYKGIPLVSTVAIALAGQHGIDRPFCFNRKEPKSHGEGGLIVGAPLRGRVLIIDDVISTGNTMDDVIPIIREAPAEVVGITVSVNRQECGHHRQLSAVEEVQQKYQVPVIYIAGLTDMMQYLESHMQGQDMQAHLEKMRQYQREYGFM